MTFKKPNGRFDGVHFSDSFNEWIKGYKKREAAINDATQLSNEVRNYARLLFPPGREMLSSSSGSFNLGRNYFSIKFENGRTQEDLTGYICMGRRNIDFSSRHTLGEFFELAFYHLIVHGGISFGIEWKEVKLGKRKYMVPSAFSYINSATLSIKKTPRGKIFRQSFSWVAKLLETYFIYTDRDFSENEIFHITYTDTASSPVSKSLKYIADMQQGMELALIQGEARNDSRNHRYDLEKSRYLSSDVAFRNQHIARVKVRRIFEQPIGGLVDVTEYYDVYAFIQFQKHLNAIREFLIEEFNRQIISRIVDINGFKKEFRLEYSGNKNNQELSDLWGKYIEGKISAKELSSLFD